MKHIFADVINGSRWLMEPRAFRAMVKRAEAATAESIQAAIQAYAGDRGPTLNMVGDVAVINMCGPITYKRSWFSMFFGGATIEDMQTQLRMALRDDSVRSIAFRCDSGGGEVTMIPEFSDEIYAARGQKPIVSIADTAMCSACLWLTAQTDAIYVSASSIVGSVGVYVEAEDISEMLAKAGIKIEQIRYGANKGDDVPYKPLSDEARAELQALVNDVGMEFDGAMARGRGVSRKVVADSFGQGKVFRGKKIIAAGLADKMGTFGQVIGKLTKGRPAMATVGSTTLVEAQPSAIVDELHEHLAPVARKTGMGSRQDGGCQTCSEACGCDEETCPTDCPTCDSGCPCARQTDTAAARDTDVAQAAADRDALALALASME